MNLNKVGDKKPKDKGRKRVKSKRRRSQNIPPKPQNCPPKYNKEKSHGTNSLGNI